MSEIEARADAIMKRVGQRMRAARIMAGLSQEKTGDILDLSFQQIQKYESGKNRIGPGELFILAEQFAKEVAWFFEGIEMDEAREVVMPDVAGTMLTLPYGPDVCRDYAKLSNQDRSVVAQVASALVK